MREIGGADVAPRRILIAGLLTGLVLAAAGARGAPASGHVSRTPISFRVANANGTLVRCSTDAEQYTISGTLIGPTALLRKPPSDLAATLYLHEFSFGKFFWTFDGVPGYDFTRDLAERGHVSVVVDRLGYDESDHPPGNATCLGAHADMVAQIVRQLKAGEFTVPGGTKPVAFQRVLLGGHSVGGGVAELAAHSFPDLGVAGLLLLGWADQGYSTRSTEQAMQQAQHCISGGEPAYPGGPDAYAYFGPTEEDFRQNVFNDTDPEVATIAISLRNRDPCGDNATLIRMALVNAAGVGSLTVPVLLLYGDEDAIFEDTADDVQARLFRSSPSVTVARFRDAGHALALERAAPQVREATAAWLEEHGFKSAPPKPPAGAIAGGRGHGSPPAGGTAEPNGAERTRSSDIAAGRSRQPPAPTDHTGTLPSTGVGTMPLWAQLLILTSWFGLRAARDVPTLSARRARRARVKRSGPRS